MKYPMYIGFLETLYIPFVFNPSCLGLAKAMVEIVRMPIPAAYIIRAIKDSRVPILICNKKEYKKIKIFEH